MSFAVDARRLHGLSAPIHRNITPSNPSSKSEIWLDFQELITLSFLSTTVNLASELLEERTVAVRAPKTLVHQQFLPGEVTIVEGVSVYQRIPQR